MLTNKQAIEYIDSALSKYNAPKKVDRHYPDYRLCEVWLSRYDIEAFEKAKDALRKLDKLNETLDVYSVGFSKVRIEDIRKVIND